MPTPVDDSQYIPGVSPAPRTTSPNPNSPLQPQLINGVGAGTGTPNHYVDGVPKTCWTDQDCQGTFTHCVQDVPTEVGICTKECSAHSDCTNKAMWSCSTGLWNATETKQMCMLTCVLNNECPTGTSCNDGICGTPCSGNNCQAQSCTSHTAIDCVGDAVYWFNSCGDLEDLKETCQQGSACVFGQCLQGGVSGATGSSGNAPQNGSCGGTIYRCGSSTTVLEVDGCGNVKDSQYCSGGKECSGGTCRCMPTSQKKCIGGTLWEVDSCGSPRTSRGPC